jgi:hypothetical protein
VVTHITGNVAEFDDNDPVDIRGYEVEGTAIGEIIGYPAVTPVYYDQIYGSSVYFWQYYPNGMIVSGPNSCASVVYGPILDFYGQLDQFFGPLGSAATDVSTLPDGTTYVVFENGVLWADASGNVSQLTPLLPAFVKGASGIDPSIAGITTFAQQTIQSNAENAIATNPQLAGQVSSIKTTAVFDSTGSGGCSGAGFNSVGTTLNRTHIFRVHFDMSLKGCAGVVGGASADLHITVRLSLNPPIASCYLLGFEIDSVSTPFGAGDADLEAGLSNSLVAEFGKDLLGATLPTGITLIAALVDEQGNVNVFTEPLCTTTALVRTGRPADEAVLPTLRRLRDEYLARTADGRNLIAAVDGFGPAFLEALRQRPDAGELRGSIAAFLDATFGNGADLATAAAALESPAAQVTRLLGIASERGGPETVRRITAQGVDFVRHHLTGERDFTSLTSELSRALVRLETDLAAASGTDNA